MKNYVLGLLLVVGLAACSTTSTPDPDNGVSNASYRTAIQRSDTNVKQLVAKLRDLQTKDLARPVDQQLRPSTWWDAEVREAEVTEKLLADTLLGATARVASGTATK